jgi:hypothetical protein
MVNERTPHDALADGAVNLTAFERRQVAVKSLGLDDRTIRRAYTDPASVRESSWRRIEWAARELALPPPPARTGGRLRTE